jgi:glycosyltransferase involved in cell wall biosynthesis
MAVAGICKSLAVLGNSVSLHVFGQSTVDVVLNKDFFETLASTNVKVEVYKRNSTSAYGRVPKFTQLRGLYSDVRASDILVFNQVFQFQLIALFPILMITRTPYVVMPHGTITSYQRRQHRIRKILPSLLISFFLKNARSIFVATESEAKELPRSLKTNAKVVGLGIDFEPNENSNFVPNSKFTILFMGRIVQKKRLDIALKAFALAAAESEKEMRFIICGVGDQEIMDQMTKIVLNLGISEKVDFRGWVDGPTKRAILLESSCFILTSEDENFAIAAAEALAAGIPCVLSSNVAISALVQKHNAGEIFRHLDPIQISSLILRISEKDPNSLENSSKNAAQEITWDRVAATWQENLKLLL